MIGDKKDINTYVVEVWHEVQASPLGSSAARKFTAKHTYALLPKLMEEKNIKMIADYHLDPEHRAILVFESPNIEALRDLLYEAGYLHWCHARIYPTTPLVELDKWQRKQPTVT